MDTKKIISIAIAGLVGILAVGFGTFFVMKGMKTKSMNQNAKATASNYLEKIRVGNLNDAYAYLSPDVKTWLKEDEYVSCMEAYIDEKGINFNIDNARQKELDDSKKKEKEIYIEMAKKTEDNELIAQAQAYSKIEFTYIPVNRVITTSVGGKTKQITDKFDLTIVYNNGVPAIYTTPDEFYIQKMNFVFGKALDYVEDSMEYENDKERVVRNLQKIEQYIKSASVFPDDFKYMDKVVLELSILNSFYKLIQGDYDAAINYLREGESVAVDVEQKVRLKSIESEIYMTQGLYDKALNVMQEALDIDPENEDIRKDFRRVSSMMIDSIEGNLVDGWSQLKSALSQPDKERYRILDDIAMVSAEKAIKVKEDCPDGYYLRGSINYAKGDSSAAISDLEKALSLAAENDTPFRTEVAQILGLARTTNIGDTEEEKENKELKAYREIINTEMRSLTIRESKISGLIDSVR